MSGDMYATAERLYPSAYVFEVVDTLSKSGLESE